MLLVGTLSAVSLNICPIFLSLTSYISALPKNYKLFKRDYSKLDSEALLSEVGNVNWSEGLRSESGATGVNSVFQNFYDRIIY